MNKATQRILAIDLAGIYSQVCDTWQKEISNYLVKFAGSKYIEVENSIIIKAHASANDAQKKLINKYFTLPKELDYKKFNTYSKVCKQIKEKELTIKDFSFLPKEDRIKTLNFAKIKQLEKCFNDDWKPDWKNTNEYKYYPYFSISSSGGLCFSGSFFCSSGFASGSGFYKSKEISDYIGKTFIDIYKGLV